MKATGAVLIWASTTVVPEGETGRFVGDDIRYNRVAATVMARHHIAINDLHALTKSFSSSDFAGPGDVHYSTSGSNKLAKQVADRMEQALRTR